MKSISVKIKQVYGKETVYPACKQSEIFAQLARQKTLTKREINLIKDLGYEIIVIQDFVSI